MIAQTAAAAARRPASDRNQRARDLVLVSVFGLWATLLGLSPLLAYRTLKILSELIVVN